MRTSRTTAQNRTLCFHGDRQSARPALLHVAGNAGECARRSRTNYDGINDPFHLLVDFAGGGFVVIFRISWILKLRCHESVGVLGGEFVGLLDRSLHALRIWGADDLGAEGPHDYGFFLREALRNEECHLVAAVHADQGEADPGIAGGRFNNGSSWPETPFFLGSLNDPDGGAVFYAPARIQVFQLGIDLSRAGRNNSFELEDGSIADELGNVVSDPQAGAFHGFHWHCTGYGRRCGSVNQGNR